MARHTHLSAPESIPTAVPADTARMAFAQRLQRFMDEKGWNQSEMARAATVHYGKEMSRDSISKYVNAKIFPSSAKLAAIAAALGVEREDLVPTKGVKTEATAVGVNDAGDGEAWLRVNQKVPWDVAVKVLNLLKGTDAKGD